jgi:hypothetical protein
MRKLRKIGAVLATTGLAAFGAVAVSGGSAYAATGLAMSSCTEGNSAVVSAAIAPVCTAGTSTIYNPTGITVTVDPSIFTVLLGNTVINALLGGALDVDVTYDLTCEVGGAPVTSTDTGFTVDSASTNTHTINLQTAVGSPAPNQCTLENLTATTLISATVLGEILGDIHSFGLDFNFGVSATGDTGIPGAIYTEEASNSAGVIPATCADDTNNGNSNTELQAFTCESDLAQQWIQASTHQFVHNGLCLDNDNGVAVLDSCITNPGNNNSQVWSSTPEGGGKVELVNTGSNGLDCLTDASAMDGAQITVAPCNNATDQMWKVPAVTPV